MPNHPIDHSCNFPLTPRISSSQHDTSSFGLGNPQDSFTQLLFPPHPSLAVSDVQLRGSSPSRNSIARGEAMEPGCPEEATAAPSEATDAIQEKPPLTRKRKRRSDDDINRPSKKGPSTEQPQVATSDSPSFSTFVSTPLSDATLPISPVVSSSSTSFQSLNRIRSPSPPTAVIPAHGGQKFTEQDIAYLHKYIQYCKDTNKMLR